MRIELTANKQSDTTEAVFGDQRLTVKGYHLGLDPFLAAAVGEHGLKRVSEVFAADPVTVGIATKIAKESS